MESLLKKSELDLTVLNSISTPNIDNEEDSVHVGKAYQIPLPFLCPGDIMGYHNIPRERNTCPLSRGRGDIPEHRQ